MTDPTRAIALAKGRKIYTPAKPCQRGHSLRNTKTGECLDCGKYRKMIRRRALGIPAKQQIIPDAEIERVFELRVRQFKSKREVRTELNLTESQYYRRLRMAREKYNMPYQPTSFWDEYDKKWGIS